MTGIDWSYWDGLEIHNTCTCMNCNQVFRSHVKFHIFSHDNKGIFSKDPCPNCSSHRLKNARSDPELW